LQPYPNVALCCICRAGVDMEKPWRLYFHHVQSQASMDRQWSYGVSVRHDVYGFIYLKHVLPGYYLVGFSIKAAQTI